MSRDQRLSDWLDAYGSRLLLYARQLTGVTADAEDAVQQAFINVWKAGKHRIPDVNAKPFLFRAVRNAAIDVVRSRQRRVEREARASDPSTARDALFHTSAERERWREEVEAAMAQLPAEQREVLALRVWGELTFTQVASVTGVSPNTAASRYRYALAALKQHMKREM